MIEVAFLRSIVQEALTIVDLEFADCERIAELVETYADFPLGTTDAAVVAAERLGLSEIATLDRRHLHAARLPTLRVVGGGADRLGRALLP